VTDASAADSPDDIPGSETRPAREVPETAAAAVLVAVGMLIVGGGVGANPLNWSRTIDQVASLRAVLVVPGAGTRIARRVGNGPATSDRVGSVAAAPTGRAWQCGPVKRPVLVRPCSSRASVGGSHDGVLVVRVREPATDGRANKAVVEAVAAALGVPRGAVHIVGGAAWRRKVVEVDGDQAVLATAWERLVGDASPTGQSRE